MIQNMKLTDEESTKDDIPITLKELTDALNTTTCNTSPGTDGYTYSVLKYIWPLVGLPMQRGFSKMIENREFYSSLRTASIKLIPKKGNCSKISNWRPNSLLSCIYKIFSKAYTQRLKKVIDKLTSNSQKAYSSTKVISEAILNILEYTKKAEI